MYYVYILKLSGKKKRFYVGVTANLERRLGEHRLSKVISTRGLFEKLLYVEVIDNKNKAWKREKYLKSGKGREWVKNNYMAW